MNLFSLPTALRLSLSKPAEPSPFDKLRVSAGNE